MASADTIRDKIEEVFWPLIGLGEYLNLTHDKIDDPVGHLGPVVIALAKRARDELEGLVLELETQGKAQEPAETPSWDGR